MTASQADYEIELIRQFKKLEQFWLNKKPEKFISKCVFFLEAYGVSPSLNVGFEEALFLAGKIKNDLRGSLSTEKVLFLLFLTLQKQLNKSASGKNSRMQQLDQEEDDEESPFEKESSTFRSFIIRYLYFLREQRIFNQVQKTSSLEQVRAQFRSKEDSQYLQFHEIESLKEIETEQFLPPKSDFSSNANGEVLAADVDGMAIPSSRNNPELCKRNSHGQFVNRKRVPTGSETESQQIDGSSSMPARRRDHKIQQKEATTKTKFDRKQGLLGKRLRPKEDGLYQLLDTPGQVFTQRVAGGDHEDQFAVATNTRIFEIIKDGKKGVSQQSQTPHQTCQPDTSFSHASQLDRLEKAKSFSDMGRERAAIHQAPITQGLFGGNRSSQDEEEGSEEPSQLDQEASAANLEDKQLEKGNTGQLRLPQNPEQRRPEQSNQQSRHGNGHHESDKTLTEKSPSACNESQNSGSANGHSQKRQKESEDGEQPSQTEDIIDRLAKKIQLDSSRNAEMESIEKLYDAQSSEDAEEESGEQEVDEQGEEEMSQSESSVKEPTESLLTDKNETDQSPKKKGSAQDSGDVEMRDEQDSQAQEGSDSSDFSSRVGAITKCYTVIKLEPKKSQAGSQARRGEGDSDTQTYKEETPSKKSDVKQGGGIYQMLMQVTHGLKPKAMAKKQTSTVSSTQRKAEPQGRSKKKNMDPQVELYQEQDIKVALNYQVLVAKGDLNVNTLKRRPRQNYLAHSEPFDLSILLDSNYWGHKQTLLSHTHEEIVRLSALNKLDVSHSFQNLPIHDFLDFKESVESPAFKVKHLYWHNEIDLSVPYQSGFKEHFWNYIQKNEIVNDNIRQYLQKAKRQTFCNCLDGCQNSRKCPCYKWNRKLQNPTYNKEMSPRSGQMIAFQQRAKTSINKVFTFNECHPRCSCNKDLCLNYLVAAQNKKKFRFLVRRMKKTLSPIYQSFQGLSEDQSSKQQKGGSQSSQNSNKQLSSAALFPQVPKNICMWGLIAMEEIPAGAFLMEYLGEIVSKKQGDMRGTYYDDNGLSYLFDLNDPSESDEREQIVQKLFYNEFFPLCLDSMFYGNEARFINHSCDPNVQSFNLTGQVQSNVYHSIGLFASRKILPGEELTLDYQWDKNDLTISQDVPCLCGSLKCRGFLMRAKKTKKQTQNGPTTNLGSLVTSKQNSVIKDTGKESGAIEAVSAVSVVEKSPPQSIQPPAKVLDSEQSPSKVAPAGPPQKLFNVISKSMQAAITAPVQTEIKPTFNAVNEPRIPELRNSDLINGEPRAKEQKTSLPIPQQQIFTTKQISPQKLIKPTVQRLPPPQHLIQSQAYQQAQAQVQPRVQPHAQLHGSPQKKIIQAPPAPPMQVIYTNRPAQQQQPINRGLNELLPTRPLLAAVNQKFLTTGGPAPKVIFNPVILPPKQMQQGVPPTTNVTLPPASLIVRKVSQMNPESRVLQNQSRSSQQQMRQQHHAPQQLQKPGNSDIRRFKQVKHAGSSQQPPF